MDIEGCSGSVVAPDIILSAAHCFDSNFCGMVIIGWHNVSSDDDDDAELYDAEDVVIHPLYNDFTYAFDVAIIKINGTTMVEPVRINDDPNVLVTGETLTLVGNGDTNNVTFPDPEIIQEIELMYVDNEICNDVWAPHLTISPDMMCTNVGPFLTPCYGDSGGPLLRMGKNSIETVQVGITSHGDAGCTGEHSAVYHRLSYTFEWTRAIICVLSSDPPAYLDCTNATEFL